MSTTKHTPGPWKITKWWESLHHAKCRDTGQDFWAQTFDIRTSDGRCLAEVSHQAHTEDGAQPNPGFGAASWTENEANARLIAAAPELLEALEYALPHLQACVPNPRNGLNNYCTPNINCVDRARAAIAKATGGAA